MPLGLSVGDVLRWRALVLPTSTCWAWMGAVGSDGYGRWAIRNWRGGQRTVTPHQVAAVLASGELLAGVTLLHDCEVRVCCRVGPGHVRIGTQAQNVRQAVARSRLVGPRPGWVDPRGPAGVSRAIQAALREAVDRSPGGLAAVLAAVVGGGDPRCALLPLFPVPSMAG